MWDENSWIGCFFNKNLFLLTKITLFTFDSTWKPCAARKRHVQRSILGNSSRTDGHRWQARKKHNEGKPAGETGLDELPAQLGAEPHTRPRRNRPSWPCRVFLALGQSPVFNFHQPKSESTFFRTALPGYILQKYLISAAFALSRQIDDLTGQRNDVCTTRSSRARSFPIT